MAFYTSVVVYALVAPYHLSSGECCKIKGFKWTNVLDEVVTCIFTSFVGGILVFYLTIYFGANDE